MSRVIAHLDMDAFFAAVEQRDHPQWRGKPVVVGADPKEGRGRGVVSTCSYEARKFGIHSAMPISKAYQRCPHAIFVRGSYQKYKDASQHMFQILYDFTPEIEPISIDEAFMDITGSYHFYKTPVNTCREIKKRIQNELKLNASIGIAPVKMVAKIASDYSKPDGLLEIKPDQMLNFLWALPINRIWGVGKKTQQKLFSLGIKTIGELAKLSQEDLHKHFGEHGIHLHKLANGIDPREVKVDSEIKSVSHEHTFEYDTNDLAEIEASISSLSEKVSRRLRKKSLKGKTLSIKVRLKGFKTYTRAHTFSESINFYDMIYSEAKRLFHEFYKPGMYIRLIGVRISNFNDPYVRTGLFQHPDDERKEQVHQVVDHIKDKFGEHSIKRGMTTSK